MSRLVRLFFGVTVLALGLVRPVAGQSGLSAPKAVGDVRVEVQPAEPKAGQSFEVILDLSVQPGMHIQAAQPLQEGLIGTELRADPAEGITWAAVSYPAARHRTDPVLGQLAEYDGDLRIVLPGTVQSGAAPGSRTVAMRLRYQACTDQGTCYPPVTVPLQVDIRVAPGQAAAGVAPPTPIPSEAASRTAPDTRDAPRAAASPDAAHLPWQPFTSQRVAELTASGKTVLIDFTADWCPNCKLNELIALNTPQTAAMVRRNEIVPLLADFTREDPEVRAWLGKFKSISVPLTVILPGSDPSSPILLRDTYRQASLLRALEQAGPSVAAQAREPLTLDTPIRVADAGGSIGWYLLAGFLGGFVLNFMPCVLPVISIKVLSLLGQAGQSRRRVLGLGLAFSVGMLALFLALGVLVTVAGQTWGAQFQSPIFLVVMLGLMVAMACSLFGAFTLTVPAGVGDADAAIEGEGYAGSFAKGVLAVVLGTPCSGPLLGSALAWAAARSAAGRPELGILVFASMGLGMASPFLVLAARPGWMRFLPRPGAWMETFKQAMGFLLLLTAVYILYLLQDRILAAVMYSLGVAFAAWLYGRLVRPGRSIGANWLGRAATVAVLAAIVWLSFAALPMGGPIGSAAADAPRAVVSAEPVPGGPVSASIGAGMASTTRTDR